MLRTPFGEAYICRSDKDISPSSPERQLGAHCALLLSGNKQGTQRENQATVSTRRGYHRKVQIIPEHLPRGTTLAAGGTIFDDCPGGEQSSLLQTRILIFDALSRYPIYKGRREEEPALGTLMTQSDNDLRFKWRQDRKLMLNHPLPPPSAA